MMGTLCQDYSGVALNQNAASTGMYAWRTAGGPLIYQHFELPYDFQRGTTATEQRIPDLSGLQVLVAIDTGYAQSASINVRLDWLASDWINVLQGTAIGAHADGSYVWFDIVLPNSVTVTPEMAAATWRMGLSIPTTTGGAFKQPVAISNGAYVVDSQSFNVNLQEDTPYPITIGGVPSFLLSQNGTVTWSEQQGVSAVSYTQPTPIVGAVYGEDDTTSIFTPNGSLNFRVLALQADSGTDFLGNEYRSVVIQTQSGNIQTTDGLNPVTGSGQAPFWQSQALPSPFAVSSLYWDVRPDPSTPDVENNFAVLNGVLIDPGTPNIYANVYYSNDESFDGPNMSEDDWEQKLWQRVPRIYKLSGRRNYAFPNPVHAKYMKIELVNPQGQSYNPGRFQLPVAYKKFPTWVANYFYQQYQLPVFTAGMVAVQYDALSLAYDYYLDDLRQLPEFPTAVPNTIQTTLNKYFTSATPQVDNTTLAQIQLAMNTYQFPAGTFNTDSITGDIATTLLSQQYSGPVTTAEGGPFGFPAISTVSSTNRDDVLMEQTLPDMYFFVTCRHTYKELTATFDYNRAYFFSLNEVAFMRSNYTVPTDTPLYIETHGDEVNIAFSDFTVGDDGVWYAYAQ